MNENPKILLFCTGNKFSPQSKSSDYMNEIEPSNYTQKKFL